ncbi:MAG: serine hydrolase [Pelobium sp.]
MKKYLFVFMITFFTVHLQAQKLIIEGQILDINSKKGIPYASIYFSNSSLGTISNLNGKFRLEFQLQHIRDSITVSYLGYKTQKISISTIKSPIIVSLEENNTLLNEVVLKSYTAGYIIKKAIKNIPDNYFTKPYKSKGFYRVTSQKDNSYIHLSEAVFDLYQSKINQPNQQFKLEKMRATKDEKASEGIDLGLKPKGIFEFDLVNYIDGFDLLNKKGLKLHDFKLMGSELVNGEEAFKISFDQIGHNKAGYKGYVLIDQNTFAFLYFNFGLSPKGESNFKFGDVAQRTLMKIIGIDITMQKNEFQIQYKKLGNKYYLNYVGNNATLTFKSERNHYNFKADTRVDYLVTKIDTEAIIPFANDETLGQAKLVEEQYTAYDPKFWKGENIMLPTADYQEIASKLEANNKANDFKLELETKLHQLPKEKSLRIDSILTFYNKKNLFNGNALIAYNGEPIFQKSYNSSLTNNKEYSQFRIGSLSKTFTAMLIAQLEAEGKLNYNDSIHQFLPAYPNGQVTIAQLLSHQSGIPNYLANETYVSKILTHEYTIEELVSQFCSDSLTFKPGSKFQYSNSNFVILSLIAEQIKGKAFKELLSTYIFRPLGMSDTYFGETKDSSNLVTAYYYGKPEPHYPVQNAGGSGGITSTTIDLWKWSKALETGQLLSLEKIEQLYQPQAAYTDWDAYYGYGWMIDRYMFSTSKKHSIHYHPGTDFGFYSMFVKQPDAGITIILLNNTGEFPRFEISELILKELN